MLKASRRNNAVPMRATYPVQLAQGLPVKPLLRLAWASSLGQPPS